jgi:hypothetical protein
MGARRPRLPKPVTVERLWVNRAHDALVVTLSTFNDVNLIDIRKHAMTAGRLTPTKKGLAIKITRLRDLSKAIDKAVRRAVELGLIDADEVAV